MATFSSMLMEDTTSFRANPRKRPHLWTSAIVDQMRQYAAQGMSMSAAYDKMIESAQLYWTPTFGTFKSTAYRFRIRFARFEEHGYFANRGLNDQTKDKLKTAAAKRGITAGHLIFRLLETACEFDMIDNILDDAS